MQASFDMGEPPRVTSAVSDDGISFNTQRLSLDDLAGQSPAMISCVADLAKYALAILHAAGRLGVGTVVKNEAVAVGHHHLGQRLRVHDGIGAHEAVEIEDI